MNMYGDQIRKRAFILILIPLFFIAGCAQVRVYSSSPSLQRVSNEYFDAEFEPQLAEGRHYFNTFRLVITNKTDKNIDLDWSQTYYLLNGRRNGQFGWDDMTFDALEGIKSQPLVTIKPGNTLSTIVFPLKLIAYHEDIRGSSVKPNARSEDRFYPGIIPEGESGIYLYLKHGGKVLRERITFNINLEILKK